MKPTSALTLVRPRASRQRVDWMGAYKCAAAAAAARAPAHGALPQLHVRAVAARGNVQQAQRQTGRGLCTARVAVRAWRTATAAAAAAGPRGAPAGPARPSLFAPAPPRTPAGREGELGAADAVRAAHARVATRARLEQRVQRAVRSVQVAAVKRLHDSHHQLGPRRQAAARGDDDAARRLQVRAHISVHVVIHVGATRAART
jgi:hypothetical protein